MGLTNGREARAEVWRLVEAARNGEGPQALQAVAPWVMGLEVPDQVKLAGQLRRVGTEVLAGHAEPTELFELVETWRSLIASHERSRHLLIEGEGLGSDADAYALPGRLLVGREI